MRARRLKPLAHITKSFTQTNNGGGERVGKKYETRCKRRKGWILRTFSLFIQQRSVGKYTTALGAGNKRVCLFSLISNDGKKKLIIEE